MAEGKSPAVKSLSIPCPHCSSRTRVPAGRVTKEGLVYACPNCKTKVHVARTAKGIAVRRATAKETGTGVEDEEDENISQEEKEIIIHGAPMWVVTFADLATLLLTFFVLMLSFANMDIVKFQELMGSVQERFGVTMLEHGNFQAVSSGSLADVDSNVVKQSSEAVAREQLVNVIYDAIIRQGFKGSASLTSTDEGVRARIKGRALFEPGQAELNKSSYKFIKEMADVIKTTARKKRRS